MTILFTLTNGKGTYDLSLAIEGEETGATIAEMRGPLEIGSPLAISDINVRLNNVRFSEAGKYWVVVKADGEILQQRPFIVRMIDSKNEDEGNG